MRSASSSTRIVIDQLVATLRNTTKTIDAPPEANTAEACAGKLPDAARSHLLTLHTIYPYVTLDALDLLDRGAVTKLSWINKDSSNQMELNRHAYYVNRTEAQSAHAAQQTLDSHREAELTLPPHEVRLNGWNCSCPAFTLAVASQEAQIGHRTRSPESSARRDTGTFGGLSKPCFVEGVEQPPPLCKHLLACVLAEHCGHLFRFHDARSEASNSRRDESMSIGQARQMDPQQQPYANSFDIATANRTCTVSCTEACGWAASGGL